MAIPVTELLGIIVESFSLTEVISLLFLGECVNKSPGWPRLMPASSQVGVANP